MWDCLRLWAQSIVIENLKVVFLSNETICLPLYTSGFQLGWQNLDLQSGGQEKQRKHWHLLIWFKTTIWFVTGQPWLEECLGVHLTGIMRGGCWTCSWTKLIEILWSVHWFQSLFDLADPFSVWSLLSSCLNAHLTSLCGSLLSRFILWLQVALVSS